MDARLPVRGNNIAVVVPVLVFVLVVFLSLSACGESSSPEAAEPTAVPIEAVDPTAVPTYFDTTMGIKIITQSEPNVPGEGDPRQPWLGDEAWIEAVQAGQMYITENPEPKNVQVLKGMTTGEVWAYMQHISGALGVSCQYCHDITNYAADPYPQKISARLMLLLVSDINTQFITTLPQWKGNYVQCASCHRGQPQNMLAFSERNAYLAEDAATGRSLQTWVIDTYAVDPTSADYVLQHPNTGVMLAMVKWMEENWDGYVLPRSEPIEGPPRNDRLKYLSYTDTYYSVPECYTCHAENRIPPGDIHRDDLTKLSDGGLTVLPPILRGTED